MAISRSILGTGHVLQMGETINAYKTAGNPKETGRLGRSARIWEDNIKTNLKELEAQDKGK
jgi:hypothetical protein